MSMLNLKVKSVNGANPVVTVDGKRVKFQKNSFGNYVARLQISDGARLKVISWDPILSPLWLLWEMLYFVISVFGIFDSFKDKIKRAFEFEAIMHSAEGNESQATVTVIRANGDGSPAVEMECNFEAEVVKNEYYGFGTIKRRRRIALVIKIAAWIAGIATAIAVVANTFGR